MTTKTKTFDCVKMKHNIQRDLMNEYRKRKTDFPCYTDFLRASICENEWSRKQLERLRAKSISRC